MATELTGHDPGELIVADIEANGMGSHTSYGTGKPPWADQPAKPLTAREQAEKLSTRFESVSSTIRFVREYLGITERYLDLLAEDIMEAEERRAE